VVVKHVVVGFIEIINMSLCRNDCSDSMTALVCGSLYLQKRINDRPNFRRAGNGGTREAIADFDND